MDTSTQATELITVKGQSGTRPKRQYRPIEGEAADRRRDLGRRCIGGAGGAVAWSQRQPGVRLAQAVSGGATGQREPCDQAVAGPRKREFAIASANNSS